MWYKFDDMHSGGYAKTEWEIITIEAECEESAAEKFELILGVDPYGVTCNCCGNDYWITEVGDPSGLIISKSRIQDYLSLEITFGELTKGV